MLRKTGYIWRVLFVLVDLSLAAAVFLASHELRFRPPVSWIAAPAHERPPFESYLAVVPLVSLVLLFTNNYFGLYLPRRVHSFASELLAIAKSNAMAALLLMTFFFMDRTFSYGRGIVLVFVSLNVATAFLLRVAIRGSLRALRARGYNLRHVLIAGTGREAQALLHAFRANRWTGVDVIGFVSRHEATVGREIWSTPVLACTADLAQLLDRQTIDQVYIALPPTRRREIVHVLEVCADRLISTRLAETRAPEIRGPVTTDFEGLRITSVWESHLSGWNAFTKRALDFAVSALALVLLSPVLAAIAIAIKLTSTGPMLYSQNRMGLDGRVFKMLKFRTMRIDAEARPHFTRPDDDRCTPLGSALRRTSIDELPQLVNVLRGQMSLVGPRPERPVFIRQFRDEFPGYMLRHRIKAGMTGWAQVNGWRGDSSLRKRLQYDLFYMHNWSIGFDMKILVLTLLRGWRHPNAY